MHGHECSERQCPGLSGFSQDGVVDEFQRRWRSCDLRDKMPQPLLIANGPLIELAFIGVYEPYQRRGYATRALQMLTTLCDESGLTIGLVVRRMDVVPGLFSFAPGCPARLSVDQLLAWCKRHGFVETASWEKDPRTMIRKPVRKIRGQLA